MKDFVIEKYIKEESVSTPLKFLNSLMGNDILFSDSFKKVKPYSLKTIFADIVDINKFKNDYPLTDITTIIQTEYFRDYFMDFINVGYDKLFTDKNWEESEKRLLIKSNIYSGLWINYGKTQKLQN